MKDTFWDICELSQGEEIECIKVALKAILKATGKLDRIYVTKKAYLWPCVRLSTAQTVLYPRQECLRIAHPPKNIPRA